MTEIRVISGIRCTARDERAANEDKQHLVGANMACALENCSVAKGVQASVPSCSLRRLSLDSVNTFSQPLWKAALAHSATLHTGTVLAMTGMVAPTACHSFQSISVSSGRVCTTCVYVRIFILFAVILIVT